MPSCEAHELSFDLADLSQPLFRGIDGVMDFWIPPNLPQDSPTKILAIFTERHEQSFLQHFAGFSSLSEAYQGVLGEGQPRTVECLPALRYVTFMVPPLCQ
jgi:hypothetical protein